MVAVGLSGEREVRIAVRVCSCGACAVDAEGALRKPSLLSGAHACVHTCGSGARYRRGKRVTRLGGPSLQWPAVGEGLGLVLRLHVWRDAPW